MPDCKHKPDCYIGVDFGTSGCRAIVIDDHRRIIANASLSLPAPARPRTGWSEQDPSICWQALLELLAKLTPQLGFHQPRAMAIDGTSGTLLLTDKTGNPVSAALMYDDSRARHEADSIRTAAIGDTAAQGASSSLAKLLWLLKHDHPKEQVKATHQAEWLAGRLCGITGHGDENNCLKLGYDPVDRRWPDWLNRLGITEGILPKVRPIGRAIGIIRADIAKATGLPEGLAIVSGTTDSIAAALAVGLEQPGDAVTSLGSTLALKIVSDKPVFCAEYGVYSHRVFDHWLVGGASNSGGAVLKQYFSDEEITEMTARLKPDQPTHLNYYPLTRPGERFPVNDPDLSPHLEPVPDDRLTFFQAILEGIADIENAGYELLTRLGTPSPARLYTAGGGSVNAAWRRIREQKLGIPLVTADFTEAAYGSALLAMRSVKTNAVAHQVKDNSTGTSRSLS